MHLTERQVSKLKNGSGKFYIRVKMPLTRKNQNVVGVHSGGS